jgi:hypothetical protein
MQKKLGRIDFRRIRWGGPNKTLTDRETDIEETTVLQTGNFLAKSLKACD